MVAKPRYLQEATRTKTEVNGLTNNQSFATGRAGFINPARINHQPNLENALLNCIYISFGILLHIQMLGYVGIGKTQIA
jgi:hypothetical protein